MRCHRVTDREIELLHFRYKLLDITSEKSCDRSKKKKKLETKADMLWWTDFISWLCFFLIGFLIFLFLSFGNRVNILERALCVK